MKQIALIFSLLLTSFCIKAQDVIVKKDATEITCKVLEITPTEVRYKTNDTLEWPVYTIMKADVFVIKYQNGTKEVFTLEEEKPETVSASGYTLNASDMYARGRVDSKNNYDAAGPMVGNFVSGILFPLGVIPSIVIIATPPKEKNINVTNSALFENPAYRAGYKKQSYNTKVQKSIIGGVAGVVVSFALGYLMTR